MTLALLACGEGGAPGEEGDAPPASRGAPPPAGGPELPIPDDEATDSVAVVFTQAEEPHVVRRTVPADSAGLETALRLLLRGPTPEERAAGIDSWFSEETAGALGSVTVDSVGRAVVDFGNLPLLIPGASSSAGSEMLLQQLNGTVFRFPEIESVEYRVEGSCQRFWEWLQYECRVVERGDGTG